MTQILVAVMLAALLLTAYTPPEKPNHTTEFLATLAILALLVMAFTLLGAAVGSAASIVVALAAVALRVVAAKKQP